MRNEPILIYGFTGFLDSGKTTFIKDTLEDPDFSADGLSTLILMIEEGEEEMSASFLEEHSSNVVIHIASVGGHCNNGVHVPLVFGNFGLAISRALKSKKPVKTFFRIKHIICSLIS
jgi:hypothetical protein